MARYGRKWRTGWHKPPRFAYCANCKHHKELLSLMRREDNQYSPIKGQYVCNVCYIGPQPESPEFDFQSEGGPSEEMLWR